MTDVGDYVDVPVLYLDLDGTVRWGKDELGRFVNGPDDVVIFDGVTELLWRYREVGWKIVGVSNQGGVALGLVSEDDVRAAMRATVEATRRAFHKLIWCPHHPDADRPGNAVCWCRKPRAGMLIEMARDLTFEARFAHDSAVRSGVPGPPAPEWYPPHLALMVGDRAEDRGCAEAANVRFMDAAEWRAGGHLREVEEALR